jgi:Calcineurin-like phosphoesterase
MSSKEYWKECRLHRDLAERTKPPPRPTRDADLPFTRRSPVRWFSPNVLAKAGLRVVESLAFGAYLDKRELQAAIPVPTPLRSHADRSELWIDYLADTGDGFAATYTIAWLVAQPELRVRGLDRPLPRASVLVMGGDEVYPLGSATEYADRLVGPYSAALPWTEEPHPDLFALPGNHDWYDGLTGFMRIFCQGKWVGGWKTSQERSYFAVALPHRWWLWGVDIQFDAYIDEPQLRFFEEQAAQLRPGDRIILCTSRPSWIHAAFAPFGYRNLIYIERTFIRPRGARLMLSLSGDSHHYAHYYEDSQDGAHKITAGGGGAFLHPTHDLPEELSIQLDPDDPSEVPQRYRRGLCFPAADASRRLALRAFGLPLVNPSFMLVTAALHALFLWISQPGLRALRARLGHPLAEVPSGLIFRTLATGLFSSPLSLLLILALVAVLVGFAKPPERWRRGRWRILVKSAMGLIHAALQLLAVLIVALVSIRLVSQVATGHWFISWLIVMVFVLGGIVGGVVMGLYLVLCTLLPGLETHGDETFSSMRLTSYKNFLRLRIGPDGVLRVYPIGLRRVPQRWRLDPAAKGDCAPWFAPEDDQPDPCLLEEPIVIDGRV